ncbi:hypothetical protein ACTXT7_012316 [Hymenolepis weldensis]
MLILDDKDSRSDMQFPFDQTRLPCSFTSYVILGSYVVQSDAGDFDPQRHQGIAYIRDHPFAPSHLQSTEMLYRIAETHRLHHSQCQLRPFVMHIAIHIYHDIQHPLASFC